MYALIQVRRDHLLGKFTTTMINGQLDSQYLSKGEFSCAILGEIMSVRHSDCESSIH